MKIEKLEELDKAATPAPCELFNDEWTCAIKVGEVYMQAPYQPPHGRGECAKYRADGAVFAAARNALPALLKVAEAAKAYIICDDEKEWPKMFEALFKAISELEAQ